MNMKTMKEEYTAPQAEVIEMEAENVIATSPGAGDNGDPDIDIPGPAAAPRRNFWGED